MTEPNRTIVPKRLRKPAHFCARRFLPAVSEHHVCVLPIGATSREAIECMACQINHKPTNDVTAVEWH